MTGWACLSCEAKGETTGTESGADVKHLRATGHATTTASTEAGAAAIANVAGREAS